MKWIVIFYYLSQVCSIGGSPPYYYWKYFDSKEESQEYINKNYDGNTIFIMLHGDPDSINSYLPTNPLVDNDKTKEKEDE